MRHARFTLRSLALLLFVALTAAATPAFAQPENAQLNVAANSVVTEADALTRARLTGEPVVVDSLTTETQLTSAMPDGTMQLTIDTLPVRVEVDGEWAPIDTELSAGSNGFYAPAATSTKVEFSPGGTTTLARIQTPSGAWLEEVSPFGILPAPSIDGAVATYSEVLPGVDLQLTATVLGMSEVIIVKNAKAAANSALTAVKFVVAGGVVTELPGGGVRATAPDGSFVSSGTPTWWDSASGSTAEGPRGNVTAQPVAHSNAKTSVSLNVAAATKSRAVTYPVYIDPDWTGGWLSFWQTDKAYPTTSYLNGAFADGQQRVGYVAAAYSPDSRNHTARSYWRMDTSGINGKQVSAAVFSVTETWAFNCTPSLVNLYTVNNATPGASYNDSLGYSYNGPIASATVAHRAGSTGVCAQSNVGFTATASVQTAATSQVGYVDFALVAGTETSNSGWKRFAQSGSLVITYNTIPTVPVISVASPTRTCGTLSAPARLNSTSGVILQAVLADPDAGASVRAEFKVGLVGVQLASPNYTSTSAAVGTRTVSLASLGAGNYAYQARAWDGVNHSAYSSLCYFTVDNTGPALPVNMSLAEPSPLLVGQSLPVRFSANPSDAITVFAYWWTPTASFYPSPPAPVLTGAMPACNTSAGAVYFVCPDGSGMSAVLTAAPIDVISTLWVASYDAAGNASTDGSSSAAPREVYAGANSSAYTFATAHGWFTDALSLPLSGPIPDSNTNPTGGIAAGSSITLGSGATMTTGVIDPVLGSVPLIQFDGATSASSLVTKTSAPVIDISQSFTVSAWADPDAAITAKNGSYIVMGTPGSSLSGFSLKLTSGKWQFCMSFPANPTLDTCATDTAVASGNMVMLTGVWDAGNRQLRLIVGDSASSAFTKAMPTATPTVATQGPVVLGAGILGSSTTRVFKGLVGNPVVIPGVVTSDQLLELYYFHTIPG